MLADGMEWPADLGETLPPASTRQSLLEAEPYGTTLTCPKYTSAARSATRITIEQNPMTTALVCHDQPSISAA